MTTWAYEGAAAAGPPLTPGRDEAREWVRSELDPDGPGPLTRFLRWLADLLPEGSGGGDWAQALQALAVVALLVVVAVLVVRFGAVGGRRVTDGRGGAVLDDTDVTADEHRRAAEAAAHAGRWDEAVVERFRALARALQDRGLVPPLPGLTADEVAAAAAARLPDLSARLHRAASLFDEVRYGGAAAGASDDAELKDLDDAVARARPGEPVAVLAAPAVPR